MDRMDVKERRIRRGYLLCGLAALIAIAHPGCVSTRQETALPPELAERDSWLSHHIDWVETRAGERIEFESEGGRIEKVDSVSLQVVGVGLDGSRHAYRLEELVLVRVEYRESNGIGKLVIGSGVTIVASLLIAMATFR